MRSRTTRSELDALVDRIAPSELAVVLVGDDGRARRRVATTIHRRSPRAARPFLTIDCAVAGPTLDAALFGRADAGMLERACGGTVFLDRVDQLPPAIQLELVRALEERHVVRGDDPTRHAIDVRLIVGTSCDLAADVEHGRWRADLYYRLDGISIAVPATAADEDERERIERVLAACAGNQTEAARRLGISRGTLLDRLDRYGVPRPRKR